jgi:hypothetical protein
LEHQAGFEPAVLQFCRLLHWASLPLVHIISIRDTVLFCCLRTSGLPQFSLLCLAYPEGFEPPLAVLETVVLPLNTKDTSICNTLRYAFRRRRRANEECVVKHTVCRLTMPLLRVLWICQYALLRLVFTHFSYRLKLIIPKAALIIAVLLSSVCRLALPISLSMSNLKRPESFFELRTNDWLFQTYLE